MEHKIIIRIKFAQVAIEMKNYNINILGLSEVRWPGHGEQRSVNGSTLLFSGKSPDEERRNGVGLLLSSLTKKSLTDWNPVSDRIITARFKAKARSLTVIQCYAPIDPSDRVEKDAFYADFKAVFNNTRKGDIELLIDDFNAKIGTNNKNRESIMGTHSLGNINENGELFIKFCQDNNLVIGDSLFPHKNIHKVTWVSPDHCT